MGRLRSYTLHQILMVTQFVTIGDSITSKPWHPRSCSVILFCNYDNSHHLCLYYYVWWNCKVLSLQCTVAVRNQFLHALLLPLTVEFIALQLNCLKCTCFWHPNEMSAAVASEWFITAVIAKIHLWALRACPFVLLLNCTGTAVCCVTRRKLTPQSSNKFNAMRSYSRVGSRS